jgi:hypothetical protein
MITVILFVGLVAAVATVLILVTEYSDQRKLRGRDTTNDL